jgi:hypothetical protein
MIDVNKITSTLAKLPDQQLQQYAQMHKNDPYIMALAMSESNRRKELRASGQGAMQEQPKVVDQMVAQMAPQQMPEDQGIGQLPAGEMNFAGGGIVAFADGGDVERYSGEFGSLTGASLDAARARAQAAQQRLYTYGLRQRQQDPLGFQTAQQELAAAQAALQNAEQGYGAEMAASGVNRAAFGGPSTPTLPAPTAPAAAVAPADNLSGMDRRLMAGSQPSIASFKTPLPPKATDKGRGKTERGAPTDKAPAAKLPGTADLATLYQDILGKQNFQDPAAEASLQLEAQERASAAADRQAIARDAERFRDAYKGRESRLAEREADIGKQRDTNKGLAFLNAGLAIMSTPGGLATAIGKGAQVGTAQFASGLDKIRSAQERLAEARDRLDDLKLNREEVTAKELRDAERRYRDVAVNAQKRTIDGVRQAAGVNEARAKNIYDKTVGMAETVYKEEQANLRNKNSVAGMIAARGDTAGLKGDKVAIDALKAQATNITNELKDPMLNLPRNAALKSAKQAELAQINAQLAQMSGLSTMLPASPTGARGGVQFLGYE